MLKKILIAFVSLLGLVLVVGLVLPSTYRVERSRTVRASSDRLYAHVARLERWQDWTPWHPGTSPGSEWAFGGPAEGVGAVRSWRDGHGGRGTLSLTQADPKTGVAYDASVDEGAYSMHGRISFEPADGGTRVTWMEEGSVGGNPLLHYLVPLLQSRLGASFESGLARLQQRVEAEAVPLPVEAKPEPVLAAPVEQAAAPSPPPAPAPAVEGAPATPPPAEVLPETAPPPETAQGESTPSAEGTPPPAPSEGTPPSEAPVAEQAVPPT